MYCFATQIAYLYGENAMERCITEEKMLYKKP
jgi:hypothetical protein